MGVQILPRLPLQFSKLSAQPVARPLELSFLKYQQCRRRIVPPDVGCLCQNAEGGVWGGWVLLIGATGGVGQTCQFSRDSLADFVAVRNSALREQAVQPLAPRPQRPDGV